MWLHHWVISPKDADWMANSIDPDQTAHSSRSSLIWVYTVFPVLSVRKLIVGFFLCPQLRRNWRGILDSGCPCIRSSKTVHARVLKFHIWIPRGKIFDAHCFLVRVISLSGVMPLWIKSKQNLMHAISYEPCMLGFWNFIYGFLVEK